MKLLILTYFCAILAAASIVETPIFIKSKSGHMTISNISKGKNTAEPSKEDINSQL